MYARFFALYALKISQTCAYHVRSKNQWYANSFRFYAYSDKNTFKMVTKLVLSGDSVNNRKVVTISMQLLIVPHYISCNILCIISSYTIILSFSSVSRQTNCLSKVCSRSLMIVCHFGLLNRHFASISGHCFQFKT